MATSAAVFVRLPLCSTRNSAVDPQHFTNDETRCDTPQRLPYFGSCSLRTTAAAAAVTPSTRRDPCGGTSLSDSFLSGVSRSSVGVEPARGSSAAMPSATGVGGVRSSTLVSSSTYETHPSAVTPTSSQRLVISTGPSSRRGGEPAASRASQDPSDTCRSGIDGGVDAASTHDGELVLLRRPSHCAGASGFTGKSKETPFGGGLPWSRGGV